MLVRHPRKLLIVVLSTVMLAAAACGGEGDGGAVASAAAVQARVVVTPEIASQPFGLAKGNYRLAWKTTGCTAIDVTLAGDTGFSKQKKSTVPNFSWIVTSVVDGTYTVSQNETACTTWEITIEKV